MTQTTELSTEALSLTAGVHHVGLTVDDLDAAAAFLTETLGFRLAGGRPDYPAIFVSDGQILLTLWQAQTESMRPFDRHLQVGLHHLALKLAAGQSLDAVHARLLQTPGVVSEFAPTALGTTGLQHLICRIPGGLRLELVSHG
jgi:catechol 2,3-dioxygenase-like lactoylglutathione lyase family enzyme